MKLKFNGEFLKQDKVTYNRGSIVNIYIVYRLSPFTNSTKSALESTLENCLFGAAKLTKNDDISKYKYSGYGIGFDSKGILSHPSGGYGRNAIIFGADLSNSKHAKNKTRSILVLGKYFIQGISNTTIYAEKIYSTNSTIQLKCIQLVIVVIYLSMAKKLLILKQKILELYHIHYVLQTFQNTLLYHIDLKLDYLDMFMILVLNIGLLQMKKYWTFITI